MRASSCRIRVLMSCHFECDSEMDRWSAQHRAFAVERYFKNNDSVIATQRLFRQLSTWDVMGKFQMDGPL